MFYVFYRGSTLQLTLIPLLLTLIPTAINRNPIGRRRSLNQYRSFTFRNTPLPLEAYVAFGTRTRLSTVFLFLFLPYQLMYGILGRIIYAA